MTPDERMKWREFEREADELKAEVLVMWGRIRRLQDDMAAFSDEALDRASQTALEKYRDEMPSETKLSISPQGARLLFTNGRPWAFVVCTALIAIVVLAWILRPR